MSTISLLSDIPSSFKISLNTSIWAASFSLLMVGLVTLNLSPAVVSNTHTTPLSPGTFFSRRILPAWTMSKHKQ